MTVLFPLMRRTLKYIKTFYLLEVCCQFLFHEYISSYADFEVELLIITFSGFSFVFSYSVRYVKKSQVVKMLVTLNKNL